MRRVKPIAPDTLRLLNTIEEVLELALEPA